MRKLILGMILAMFTTVAHADYTMVVLKAWAAVQVFGLKL